MSSPQVIPSRPIERPTLNTLGRAQLLADGALLLLMLAVAGLLGCQELFDGDVWWHLRAGQWIWANHKVPALDPFTFASADRLWIDLHWLFQVSLAAAFTADGVRGMILMTAVVSMVTLGVGLTARRRGWPSWVVAACWLPAVAALSARLVPRPELFTYLAIALYLAVLVRTDDHPALAWVLPAVQIFWVNAHALFVLGPAILVVYLIADLASARLRPASVRNRSSRLDRRRWWLHVGGATIAVGLSCLANPYGLRGTLFPIELFPKITWWGGPYKALVVEFLDLREYIRRQGLPALGSLYTRTECFLLWAVPLSFLVPAAWRASRPATSGPDEPRASSQPNPGLAPTAAWVGTFGLAGCLILASALGLPTPGSPRALAWLGRLAPTGLGILGLGGAALLWIQSSRCAALLVAIGGLAEAAWVAWLRADLLGPEPSPMAWLVGRNSLALDWAAALLGGAAAVLLLRASVRALRFRLLLAVIFGYLAMQAVRNIGLFALVAGFILAWNLGGWAAELSAARSGPIPRYGPALGLAAQVVLAGLVGLVIFTVVSGSFFRASGEVRRLGLRETPLAYAHDAARFAGRLGLPDRALVFDLRQAGVYLFHNGPAHQLFMDGRLEVPSRSTFETYIRLDYLLTEGRPGWADPVRRMGDPLILLDHETNFGAEATLLTNPDWRCIYYDLVASVFVSRRRRNLESAFPNVNFAARHFDSRDRSAPAAATVPFQPGEAKALLNLGSALRNRPGANWELRLTFLLLAADRLRLALDANPAVAAQWTMLGNCYWNMIPDLRLPLPGPDGPWDPATGLLPAQASFCYRRALERNPRQLGALVSLRHAFQARRMRDAEHAIADQAHRAGMILDAGNLSTPSRTESPGASPHGPSENATDGLSRTIANLVHEGRGEAAARLVVEAGNPEIILDWPSADRVAATLFHLGRPADARRLWERAQVPKSGQPALRLARIAAAALAALDATTAEQTYRAALEHDPTLGEAWFGLALLHTQRGNAAAALSAARAGLRQSLTPAQTAFLRGIEALALQATTGRRTPAQLESSTSSAIDHGAAHRNSPEWPCAILAGLATTARERPGIARVHLIAKGRLDSRPDLHR
jgi:tetratricopeptide (TPR) repeat protein